MNLIKPDGFITSVLFIFCELLTFLKAQAFLNFILVFLISIPIYV